MSVPSVGENIHVVLTRCTDLRLGGRVGKCVTPPMPIVAREWHLPPIFEPRPPAPDGRLWNRMSSWVQSSVVDGVNVQMVPN